MSSSVIQTTEELIKLAKKYDLKSLTAGSVSFVLNSSPGLGQSPETLPLDQQMPADDVMMFASADSPIQVPSK